MPEDAFSQNTDPLSALSFWQKYERTQGGRSTRSTNPDNPVNVTPGPSRLDVKHYFRDYGKSDVPKLKTFAFIETLIDSFRVYSFLSMS